MRTLLIVALLGIASPALAGEWVAADHSTLAIYGSPDGAEYEAFLNGNEECQPAAGSGRVIAVLYCGADNTTNPEKVLRTTGGVIFRGKFYAAK